MAEFMVGRAKGSKDRYMVGWNESKSNSSAYKVGGGDGEPAPSSKGLPGDQDAVVGSKSQFNHAEKDTKDDGSKSMRMNFGGAISSGAASDPTAAAGQVELEYVEKGDWSEEKNAMAKRKAQMDAYRQISGASQYDTPTADLISVNKK